MDIDYPKFIPRKVRELALEKRLGTFLLINSSEFEWWCEEYIFEEGVIRGRLFFHFFSVTALYLWREVSVFKSASKTFILNRHEVSSTGFVETQHVYSIKMQFYDGKIWKINFYGNRVQTAATYFSIYGVRDHEASRSRLASIQIEEKIATAQVEQMRARLEAGGKVDFGRISATIEGITWSKQGFLWKQGDPHFVPWKQVIDTDSFDLSMGDWYNFPAFQLLRDISK